MTRSLPDPPRPDQPLPISREPMPRGCPAHPEVWL